MVKYVNGSKMTKKSLFLILLTFTLAWCVSLSSLKGQGKGEPTPAVLMGNRFLTLNTIIRVNQVEVSRDRNEGLAERSEHTPERVIASREAVSSEFPGARITWAFSWMALHNETENYKKICELEVGYHLKYGDDITFIPGAYFANAYNTGEQVNKNLQDKPNAINKISPNGLALIEKYYPYLLVD